MELQDVLGTRVVIVESSSLAFFASRVSGDWLLVPFFLVEHKGARYPASRRFFMSDVGLGCWGTFSKTCTV